MINGEINYSNLVPTHKGVIGALDIEVFSLVWHVTCHVWNGTHVTVLQGPGAICLARSYVLLKRFTLVKLSPELSYVRFSLRLFEPDIATIKMSVSQGEQRRLMQIRSHYEANFRTFRSVLSRYLC